MHLGLLAPQVDRLAEEAVAAATRAALRAFQTREGLPLTGELDAATSNFDATFLRMPVESEDIPVEDPEDAAAAEELHDDTFLGFTFDIRERDRPGPSPHEARQRTHHYQQP